MYTPKHFELNDKGKILNFLNNNAFGQLTSTLDGKLFATHIPFLFSDDGAVLFCHMAKANPQWKNLEEQEVLITFQSDHDYISPSWYTDPGVPTWNYQAVHVYGRCRVIHDIETLKGIVEETTAKYEAQFPQPWVPDYRVGKLGGIVGIEVRVTEMQSKFKLSQNRSLEERAEVIRQLEAKGSTGLATAMREL